MVQIIPQRPSASALFGQGLGQGVNTGLATLFEDLARKQAKEMDRRRTERGLEAYFSPEQAKQLSHLETPILQAIIKDKLQEGARQNEEALLRYLRPELFPTSETAGIPSEQTPATSAGGFSLPNPSAGLKTGTVERLEKIQRERENTNLKREKNAHLARTANLKYLDPYQKKLEAIDKNLGDYRLIYEGVKSGQPIIGYQKKVLDLLGLGELVNNPATDIIAKVTSRLGQNTAANAGTNKVTNFLAQQEVKSQPHLYQTREGIAAVAVLNALSNSLGKIDAEEREKIIEEKGYVPDNINKLVRDRVEKRKQEVLDEELKLAKLAYNPKTAHKIFSLSPDQFPNTYAALGLQAPEVSEKQASMIETESPEKAPTDLGFLGRSVGGGLARLLEGAAGLPADLLQAGSNLTNFATRSAGLGNALPENIPFTSDWLKQNITKPLTGESLEPQGNIENFVQEVASFVPAFISPSKLAPSALKAGVKALSSAQGIKDATAALSKVIGKAAAGTFAKNMTEKITGSPLLGEGVRIGTILLSSSAGARNALKKERTKLYDEAQKIAENIPAPQVDVPAYKAVKDIRKHFLDLPGGELLKETVEHALKNTKVGTLRPEDAISVQKALNNMIYKGDILPTQRTYLEKLKQPLNEYLKKLANSHKDFGAVWKPAEELTVGLNAGKALQDYAKKAIGTKGDGSLNKYIGLKILTKIITNPAVSAALGIGAKGINETFKVGSLLAKSPTARKHYGYLVKGAANKSPLLFAKGLKGLYHDSEK